LLVHEDAFDEFSNFGQSLPVFSSRTSFPNTGACIELRDENGSLISWAIYNDEWFDNDYYRSGGWLLKGLIPAGSVEEVKTGRAALIRQVVPWSREQP